MSIVPTSTRARWLAEYREARKVRQFERAFHRRIKPCVSLAHTIRLETYTAAGHFHCGVGDWLGYTVKLFGRRIEKRRNIIVGPSARLP